MMAAYQPTPVVGHPGLPHGHPGMAPTPGHMGQPMQMHPGVSGAPHVSQPGAMMGMQPGAQGLGPGGMGGQHPSGMMQAQMGGQSVAGGMPGQQAMSHMTPQQQMQQQHAMMQQMQSNPQLLQQQQAQMMRMRQQQQQMLQQHAAAQQNGMGGMHQGMQLTPQQMAQMQHAQAAQQQAQQHQGGGQSVQLPAHLMQQQMALHQQRMQHQAQQQQQTQLQQQMAMQHVNSQQSNQGQPTPQNPQAQPSNPQQIRPQSRMANPNEQAQAGQQQHQPQGQTQQGPGPNQQSAQQGQQANAPTAPHTLQQRQQIAMLQRNQAIARQQAMQNQGATQQVSNAQGGMFILRLMSFSDHLGQFTEETGKQIATWNSLVDKHFASEGRLVHSFDNNPAGKDNKTYEVLRPNVARYFWTYFDSGASSLRLHTENAREVPHASGSHQVTCQNAIFSVTYPNGARLEMAGSLYVLFSAGSDAIECLHFSTTNTDEIISRSHIEKVVSDWSPSLPNKSPKMAKNKLPKAQQKMQEQQDRLTMEHFPKAPKGTYGVSSKVQHFLEIGETMNMMSDLMWWAQEKKVRPEQALEQFAAQSEAQATGQLQRSGNPQINLPPNGIPQGARTPSMGNMQMLQNGQVGAYASPSVANMNLPNGMNGSPHLGSNPGNLALNMGMPNSHTPSPHQSNMAAPPMVPQHSQQGTNSSVASANTSPNMNNTGAKRRRSAVKLEGDDGGGQDNSNRVKPSPRMAKKPKP